MKAHTPAALLLTMCLTACANINQNTPTRSTMGVINSKDTVIEQSSRSNPLGLGIGLAGGHVGFGLNFGLGGTQSRTSYQYQIKLSEKETLSLRSDTEFALGSCVTVLERTGDTHFPKITANPSCTAPIPAATP
mgnify:CR=1 FL=1